uniref:Uncharacterized protein n=1 Tax=Cucumis melo TaxID=3656 RepID=A0A9I9E8P9_CUCME
MMSHEFAHSIGNLPAGRNFEFCIIVVELKFMSLIGYNSCIWRVDYSLKSIRQQRPKGIYVSMHDRVKCGWDSQCVCKTTG